jgi:hypothetical protein
MRLFLAAILVFSVAGCSRSSERLKSTGGPRDAELAELWVSYVARPNVEDLDAIEALVKIEASERGMTDRGIILQRIRVNASRASLAALNGEKQLSDVLADKALKDWLFLFPEIGARLRDLPLTERRKQVVDYAAHLNANTRAMADEERIEASKEPIQQPQQQRP